jgi:hypothetical protein
MFTGIARNWYAATRRAGGAVRDHLVRAKTEAFNCGTTANLECDTADIGQFVCRKLVSVVGTSPFPPNELMLMCAAMLWLRPSLVVEWGTNIGVSARIWQEINIHYELGANIHSIDLPDSVQHCEHPGNRRGILVRGLPVHLHQGDGPEVAAALIARFGCRKPLVFIDGDHSEAAVYRDARAVLDVAPQASVLFHDTFYQPSSSYNHGPYFAVQRLLAEITPSFQVIRCDLGCPGMTLLTPPA